ncbi:MAG: hypothetical protein WC955_04170 [Elusimicrobiota bacterium]
MKNKHPKKCQHWLKLIHNYCDDCAINTSALILLQRHIEQCPCCAMYYHTYTKTISICSEVREVEVPVVIHRQFWVVIHKEIHKKLIKKLNR